MHILSIVSFTTATLSFLLGVFVLLKGPAKMMNVLWFLTCTSIAMWSVGFGMMICSKTFEQSLWFTRWLEYPGAILIPAFFLHFVTKVLALERKKEVITAYALSSVFQILNQTGWLVSVRPQPPFTFYAIPLQAYWTFVVYFFSFVIYTHYLLFREMQASLGRKKEQIRYIFWGTSAGFVGGATTFLLVYGVQFMPIGIYLVPLYALFVCYSIFKHQLMDIRLVIQKALAYSIVSAILTAVYVGLVLLLVNSVKGDSFDSGVFITISAACIVSALFHPLGRSLQTRVDRLFARPLRDREAKLMAFTADVISQENTERMTDSLCTVISDGLSPTTTSVYLLDDESKEFVQLSNDAESSLPKRFARESNFGLYFTVCSDPIIHDLEGKSGSNSGNAELMRAVLLEMDQSHLRVAVPLLLRGALLGFFLLGPKRSGELYTDEDRVLLKLIANQATLAYERPRLMKEITSGFVHEIKMPLSNIALPAELSYMDLEDLENGKKSLGDIVPKIKTRLKAIMSQAMLAGEKIETIRQVSDVDRLGNSFAKVSEIVEKSLFQTQDLLHKTFIGVTVDVKNPGALIRGSAKQIEIVLINLIKNAVDAMVEGRAENRRLEIRATEEKGMVYLDVHDNGPGIPPAQIEAIFEPHFSTKGSAGSGMGLYLSRQIVKAHGGVIHVKSDSTIGTCFSIRLPKCDSEIQKVALSNQLGGK